MPARSTFQVEGPVEVLRPELPTVSVSGIENGPDVGLKPGTSVATGVKVAPGVRHADYMDRASSGTTRSDSGNRVVPRFPLGYLYLR